MKPVPQLRRYLARIGEMRAAEGVAQIDEVALIRQVGRGELG